MLLVQLQTQRTLWPEKYLMILKIKCRKQKILIAVRETFDGYNLISALHSFHSIKDENYKNILPPLTLLSEQKLKELIEKLNKLKFISEKNLAA